MDIYELIKTRRTIRKFTRKPIPHDLLVKFIDHARFTPSGVNRQPVRYMIVDDVETCDKVFPHTHWAGLIKDGSYGKFEYRPTAYILMLLPEGNNKKLDVGAVAQSIQLMAHNEGIGCCWMGAIERDEIAMLCNVPNGYVIDTLISLGYPAEKPLAVDMTSDDTSYFKDIDGRLNVPKLGLDEVLFK